MGRVHIVESKGGSCAHGLRAMAISQVGWCGGIAAGDCRRGYKELEFEIQRFGWWTVDGDKSTEGEKRRSIGNNENQSSHC